MNRFLTVLAGAVSYGVVDAATDGRWLRAAVGSVLVAYLMWSSAPDRVTPLVHNLEVPDGHECGTFNRHEAHIWSAHGIRLYCTGRGLHP